MTAPLRQPAAFAVPVAAKTSVVAIKVILYSFYAKECYPTSADRRAFFHQFLAHAKPQNCTAVSVNSASLTHGLS
jgi:hypothetical protein